MIGYGLPQAVIFGRVLPAVGLGTARLGAFWQGRSIRDGRDAVQTALSLGINVIDTADVYARGIAERIIGSVVGRRSDAQDALIVTKAGLIKTPAAMRQASRLGSGLLSTSTLGPARIADTCFHPEYLAWAAAGSCKRLRRDSLDVLLLHEPDESVLRSGEAAEALSGLCEAGRLQRWGASVRTLPEVLAAMDLPGLTWLQAPLSVIAAPDFAAVAHHQRRPEVTIQAMAITGHGLMTSASERQGAEVIRPQEQIAERVHWSLTDTEADLVLVGMSSGRRVYQNAAAIQRAYTLHGQEDVQ